MIGPLREMVACHWSILQNGGLSLVKIEKDCASLHRSWHKSKRSALAGVEMMELMLHAFTSSTVIRGGRYIDEKLSKANKTVFLKLSATYQYRKMEILKLSKNYRYRKMHQILAEEKN